MCFYFAGCQIGGILGGGKSHPIPGKPAVKVVRTGCTAQVHPHSLAQPLHRTHAPHFLGAPLVHVQNFVCRALALLLRLRKFVKI